MNRISKIEGGPEGLALEDAPIISPGKGQVLIRVMAAAICGSDIHIYQWNKWAENLYQGQLPMPMGHEFCGIVVEVGEGGENFRPGERVCGETHISCGVCDKCLQGLNHICDHLQLFSKTGAGCFSEYTTVPAKCLLHVPDALSDQEGVLLEPFGVAVRAVKTANISGKSVMIQGCGAIGLMAIQAAKALGASRIFASDLDQYRLDFAKRLGADVVLNSATENVAAEITRLTDGIGVRALCDFTGSIQAMETGFNLIAKGGRYILVGLPSRKMEVDVVHDLINREITVQGCYGRHIFDTWHTALELIACGKVDVSQIITHCYSLEEYETAFQTAAGRQCGKVVFLNHQKGRGDNDEASH